jgi:hypothetical protein
MIDTGLVIHTSPVFVIVDKFITVGRLVPNMLMIAFIYLVNKNSLKVFAFGSFSFWDWIILQ